jgi:hypothetical protein
MELPWWGIPILLGVIVLGWRKARAKDRERKR